MRVCKNEVSVPSIRLYEYARDLAKPLGDGEEADFGGRPVSFMVVVEEEGSI